MSMALFTPKQNPADLARFIFINISLQLVKNKFLVLVLVVSKINQKSKNQQKTKNQKNQKNQDAVEKNQIKKIKKNQKKSRRC